LIKKFIGHDKSEEHGGNDRFCGTKVWGKGSDQKVDSLTGLVLPGWSLVVPLRIYNRHEKTTTIQKIIY
jgi:hypothetical protein